MHLLVKKCRGYHEGGTNFEQILEVRTANRLTTANPSTYNQLQAALTSAQQAVSEALGLDSLPPAETVASSLHNHTLNFARTVGQFVGQLQNEVRLCDDVYIHISKFKEKESALSWFSVWFFFKPLETVVTTNTPPVMTLKSLEFSHIVHSCFMSFSEETVITYVQGTTLNGWALNYRLWMFIVRWELISYYLLQ